VARAAEVLPDDDDDPMRTAMRQMAGVFFELERKMLLKRLKNGRAEKARQGGYIGGTVPMGTRVVDGEFAADEAEQAVITRVRELHDEGKSLRQIAAAMEAEGHRTKAGTTWYPATVRRLLAAEAAEELCLRDVRRRSQCLSHEVGATSARGQRQDLWPLGSRSSLVLCEDLLPNPRIKSSVRRAHAGGRLIRTGEVRSRTRS
jgi:Recombinase/Resolvase, N terminal domain